MTTQLKPPPVPCGSCPYRKDVPSGIWAAVEYDKLTAYDGEIIDQMRAGAIGPFMCHQQDGHLCGGWLACHGSNNLAALRIAAIDGRVGKDVWDYTTKVPVFASGAEARAHGIKNIDNPDSKASKMIDGLLRKRGEA